MRPPKRTYNAPTKIADHPDREQIRNALKQAFEAGYESPSDLMEQEVNQLMETLFKNKKNSEKTQASQNRKHGIPITTEAFLMDDGCKETDAPCPVIDPPAGMTEFGAVTWTSTVYPKKKKAAQPIESLPVPEYMTTDQWCDSTPPEVQKAMLSIGCPAINDSHQFSAGCSPDQPAEKTLDKTKKKVAKKKATKYYAMPSAGRRAIVGPDDPQPSTGSQETIGYSIGYSTGFQKQLKVMQDEADTIKAKDAPWRAIKQQHKTMHAEPPVWDFKIALKDTLAAASNQTVEITNPCNDIIVDY